LILLSRLSKRLVLALDADAAGIKAGLKSAHLALNAGFDVKIPTFPLGKDPADIARENPELLKAAIRTSKTAVEFFLNALQFSARDERGYKKLVEQLLLPLIAAMESKIDQEHFARIVAQHLSVSETAVLAEVAKIPRGAMAQEVDSPDVHVQTAESLTPLERKIGMLLYYFAPDSPEHTRLVEIFGRERVEALRTTLLPQAESLLFQFERELGEHTTSEVIAQDMLEALEEQVRRERVKNQFL